MMSDGIAEVLNAAKGSPRPSSGDMDSAADSGLAGYAAGNRAGSWSTPWLRGVGVSIPKAANAPPTPAPAAEAPTRRSREESKVRDGATHDHFRGQVTSCPHAGGVPVLSRDCRWPGDTRPVCGATLGAPQTSPGSRLSGASHGMDEGARHRVRRTPPQRRGRPRQLAGNEATFMTSATASRGHSDAAVTLRTGDGHIDSDT
jgi:hypothetical protein